MLIGAVASNGDAIRLYERRGFVPAWVYMTRFGARVRRGTAPSAAAYASTRSMRAPSARRRSSMRS